MVIPEALSREIPEVGLPAGSEYEMRVYGNVGVGRPLPTRLLVQTLDRVKAGATRLGEALARISPQSDEQEIEAASPHALTLDQPDKHVPLLEATAAELIDLP